MIAGAVVTLAVIAFLGAIVQEVRSAPSMRRKVKAVDGHTVRIRIPADVKVANPLTRLHAEWLADDRPAFETVDAFERDVERVMLGGPVHEYEVAGSDADERAHAEFMAGFARLSPPNIMGACPHRSWTGTRCDDCGTTVPF